MFGDTPYSGLPYGDFTTGPSNAVIAPQTLATEATIFSPTLVLDYVHPAETLRIDTGVYTPNVKIKFVARPGVLDTEAVLHAPTVINRLPAAWFRERLSNAPVWLVEITPPNGGGTLYFSTRNLRPETGARYEDYISSITGLGEELRRGAPLGLNADISIEFRNDPWGPYAHLVERGEDWPFEGADVVIKEAYLYGDNLISQPVTLFRGNLEPPQDMDLMRFTCRVSSREFMADRRWKQARVEQSEFPDAWEDAGKIIPIVYGAAGKLPALRTSWGARTTLAEGLTAGAGQVELSDASRFPSSGYAWIEGEKVQFTRSGNTMSLSARGVSGGTEATAHRRGAQVWEHRAYYDSVLADHALHSVGDVYAEIDGELVRVLSGVSTFVDAKGRQMLRASEQIRVDVADSSLELNDQLTVDDNIAVTGAPATRKVYPTSYPQGGNNPTAMVDGNEGTFNALPGGTFQETAKVWFNTNNYGSINKQYFWVKMIGKAKIGNTIYQTNNLGWVRHYKSGGNWGDSIFIYTVQSSPGGQYESVNIYEVYKEVEYNPGQLSKSGKAYRSGAVILSGGVVSTRNVERFHADVQGYKDLTGAYGGAGTLIERPDHVVRHFLIERLGYDVSEVDAGSFDIAGAKMAAAIAGGYRFAFALTGEETPSELLREMAFESRSVLRHDGTRWTLAFLPDTAPAAKNTVNSSDIAGDGAMMTFERTPLEDIMNDQTVRYDRNYTGLGSEPDWAGSQKTSQVTSIEKYGSYPKSLDLRLVRIQFMALSVSGHIIAERAFPRLRVKLTVFTEHFNLAPGDTFDIANGIFNGRKFFVEHAERQDSMRMQIEGLEWY